MAGINLLPPEVRVLEKRINLARVLRNSGLIVLVISVAVAGLFVYLNLNSRSQLSTIKTAISQTNSLLTSARETESETKILLAKYQSLRKILSNRPLYSKLLESLSKNVPADVQILDVNVLSPTRVSVSGDSLSYLSLAKFLKVLSPDKSGVFTKAVLNSVVLNSQSGHVQFVVELNVKEGALL